MGVRDVQFGPNEWFHCYTRGVDKRDIFLDDSDRERFLMLLYVCNSTTSIHLSGMRLSADMRQGRALVHVLEQERGEQYVDLGAYCLMGNHTHLVMRENLDHGISNFMQKLGTGYTMYFNKKYERTGTLFSSRFKAKHVATDEYFKRLINYVHANPAELFEPGWKKGEIRDEARLRRALLDYRFSSLVDYESPERVEGALLARAAVLELLDEKPSLATLLQDARDFVQEEGSLE